MGTSAGVFPVDADRDIAEMYKFQAQWDGRISEKMESSVEISYFSSRYDAQFNQIFPAGVWPVGPDGNLFTGDTLVNFVDGIFG